MISLVESARMETLPEQVRLVTGAAGELAPRDLAAMFNRIVTKELSPVFIAFFESRHLFLNEAYMNLYGIPPRSAEAVEEHFLLLRGDIDEITPVLKNPPHSLTRSKIVSGALNDKHFRVNYFPIMDQAGRMLAVGGVFAEITSLIAVSEQLRESQDTLNDIVRASSDWIWKTDENAKLLYVSDRIVDVVGFPVELLVGRDFLTLVQTPGDEGAADELFRSFEKRTSFRNLPVAMRDRKGAVRQHVLSGVPYFDAKSGKFSGFRGTGSDISRQYAAEHAAQMSTSQLQAVLRQLSSQNTTLTEVLERERAAARAKSDFLANVSHELRTPLNAIIGMSDMLHHQFHGELNEKQAEYVGHILHAGRHLLGVISDILDMSKIAESKMTLSDSVVALPDLVRECFPMVAPRAAASELTLNLEIVTPPPLLRADALRLRQVLINLLSNAAKFTAGPGFIVVRIDRAPDGAVIIDVIDTGIGMTEEEIELAQLPFQQIENPFIKKHEGTGLGLPIAAEIMRMHGGTLTIASKPGQGTTVSLRLPVERNLVQTSAYARDDNR